MTLGAAVLGAGLVLAGCSGSSGGGAVPATRGAAASDAGAPAARALSPLSRTNTRRPDTVVIKSKPGCTSVDTGGYYGLVFAKVVYTTPIKHAVIDGAASDGSFCDVVVYIPPTVTNAVIDQSVIEHGRLVGILAQNTTNATVTQTVVQQVGDGYQPGDSGLYGLQNGVDIDYENSSGHVQWNLFWQYQKNGTEFYQSTLAFDHNVAVGTDGPPNTSVNPPYDVIAQNGFEVDYSTIVEGSNSAFRNQYNNPNDPVYNRGAAGFLYFGATTGGHPFTCADFTRDRDFAPSYLTDPVLGNDIPFYAAPNYTVDGTCKKGTGATFAATGMNPTSH